MLLTSFDPFRTSWPARAALPMDGTRRENDVVLRFDLPGVGQDNIEVSVDRGVLSVSAKRDEERSDSDRPFVRERVTGTLRRRVYLGDAYDADQVEAAYENGVLTVRVPLAEKAKARKVEVGNDTKKMITA
ncbi:MAG TPA: Hsp20/alpha crystallin family protein [Streptosporangiaceae bacterium]